MKRSFLQVFKVTLNVNSGKAPDLNLVREMVYETAIKLWFAFLDAEKKQSYKAPWEIPTQIQSVTNVRRRILHSFLPKFAAV